MPDRGKTKDDGPPTFDGPRFARKLTRWMEAERLSVGELAERSGLDRGVIQTLRRGEPAAHVRRARGQTTLSPGINTIAAVAYGLGLQFTYVAAWAGLADEGDRWVNFTAAEREALAAVLGDGMAPVPPNLDAVLHATVRAHTQAAIERGNGDT